MDNWTLSVEFEPAAAGLKDSRKLGELYVTGMVYEKGKLYAVSKNFNMLIVINIASESIEVAYGLQADLTNLRGFVKKGNTFEVLDHNRIVTLQLN